MSRTSHASSSTTARGRCLATAFRRWSAFWRHSRRRAMPARFRSSSSTPSTKRASRTRSLPKSGKRPSRSCAAPKSHERLLWHEGIRMPELEIHDEGGEKHDPTGQRIGIMAAVLAVLLAVVTIASHRTHTEAIIARYAANDAWANYQATRVKLHSIELGENLVHTFGGSSEASKKMLDDYAAQKKKYEAQGKDIQQEAEGDSRAAEADEERALRFDIGEGLLEIGLVLSSLYFISHRKMFPVMGVTAGIAGVV